MRGLKQVARYCCARTAARSPLPASPLCDPRKMRGTLLFLSVLSCTATDLEHRIDALAEASAATARGFTGIHVVDLATGKTLYHRNEDRLFLPASNMKLFTTALALLRLGPEYRFTTQLLVEPSGNLVLAGSGDPSLSGRTFPYQKDAVMGPRFQAIDDLADQAVANGLRRVDGDVVGDDRLYPWAPYPPSWTQDDALREFGAPVSALTVNDNIISIVIHPGAHAGEPAELSIEPPLEYYAIDHRVVTVGKGGEAKIRMSRLPGSRQIQLWGSIPAGHAGFREELAIDDPALFAACALYEALTRRGVSITGRPVARHRAANDDYDPPAGAAMASRTSPPLVQLLQTLAKVSQNLHAELMLREVGRVMRHTGSREAGLEELGAMLTEMGAVADEARAEDGSGLSRNALVTPHLVTRLLAGMYASKYRDAWISLLPVGGEDGTLQHRLCCMVEGRGIHAKTGSLSRALALSGYADSKTRGRLAFSIMVNDFSAPSAEVRKWIDKIALALLE
jgi:serine-type D-Ala-D-Ala carboxypeptidase/endopeptidase (penicillin-binding protein 4)